MKWYEDFDEAVAEARKTGEPLWDTHSLPWRYGVGYPSIEDEEDPSNLDWEEVIPLPE